MPREDGLVHRERGRPARCMSAARDVLMRVPSERRITVNGRAEGARFERPDVGKSKRAGRCANTHSGPNPASLDLPEERRLMPTIPEPSEGVNTPPAGRRPVEIAYTGNRTKPNRAQPDRCPSIDPLDTLQCGRRIHDDDQCQLGGIAWKKGTRPPYDPPPVLYHWSPSRNRLSIEREGLRPGSPSNTFPEWSPPHICYGETPASAHGLTLLDDALDLWMVRTDGHVFTLANEGAEWRSTEQVEAWWVGSRPPRDPVIDMTPAEQAEADEIVAYLHEQDIADIATPPGRPTGEASA